MTSSNSNTFNVSEKLNVSKITLPEIPEDIIFPNELNTFLREQIQYQVHENGMLQKKLCELEAEHNDSKAKISELENKLGNYERLCNKNEFVTSNQIASTKIVELSKRLREKNSEVESLKTKYSKLEKHLFDLKRAALEDNQTEVVEEKPVNELEEQVKKLSEKLTSITSKHSECKNNNLQLKNDLKLANKLLQQEIGESFENLQALNNLNGNWRGRAQIICDLQQKNTELKEKLKAAREKAKNSGSQELNTSNKVDSKVSILSMENTDLKTKYEDLKKKNDALRARCKVLDSEYTMLKSKVAVMKEQSDRDQDIISTLSLQISSSKDTRNEMIHQKERVINKLQNEKKLLVNEIEEYKIIIKNMRELPSKEIDTHSSTQISTCTCTKEMQHNEGSEKSNTPETEKLIQLLELQSNRLKTERDEHAKTHSLLRIEKQRAARAEAAAARKELESNTCRSGYSSCVSLKSADSALRDQLELVEENVKALKTRLDIEQFERRSDMQEFSKILQSYENRKNKD